MSFCNPTYHGGAPVQYFEITGVCTVSLVAGMAYTATRGSDRFAKIFMSVRDTRLSSRPLKLSDHGLLYRPSPGQFSCALSAFDVMMPAGSFSAAVSSLAALAASTLMIVSASRARSELANLLHFVGSPP